LVVGLFCRRPLANVVDSYFHKGAAGGSEPLFQIPSGRGGFWPKARLYLPCNRRSSARHQLLGPLSADDRVFAATTPSFRSEEPVLSAVRGQLRFLIGTILFRAHHCGWLQLSHGVGNYRALRAWAGFAAAALFPAVVLSNPRTSAAEGRRCGLGIDLAAVPGSAQPPAWKNSQPEKSSIRSHQSSLNREHCRPRLFHDSSAVQPEPPWRSAG